jgi:uracil-DNA glycosylase family 4
MADRPTTLELLRWYQDAGVDECIGEVAIDRFRPAPPPAAKLQPPPLPVYTPPPPPPRPTPGLAEAPVAVPGLEHCSTLEELRDAVEAYDGCALKTFASRTVFAQGAAAARVMLIGEAPGEDEDRQGFPFVGVSGKLLDRMLASIGLDRTANAYITNIVFWRPPGNRKPTPEEVSLCLPFVRRHVEILNPAVLILLGGPSASAMLGNPQGITKLRGRWYDYMSSGLAQPIPAMPTFHPAYLLRSPQQKRLAWRDLLAVRQKIESLGIH